MNAPFSSNELLDFDRRYSHQLHHHNPNLNGDPILDAIQQDIIRRNDLPAACLFAAEFPYRTYLMQSVILKSRSPRHLFLFALSVPNANIPAIQQTLFNSSSKSRLKFLTLFSCQIEGADRKRIEQTIIKAAEQDRGAVRYAFNLLQADVAAKPARRIKELLLQFGSPAQLFFLAQIATYRKEVAQIEELLIREGSFKFVRKLAATNQLANIERLEAWVLESGDVREIKRFAKEVRKSKSRGLAILF